MRIVRLVIAAIVLYVVFVHNGGALGDQVTEWITPYVQDYVLSSSD